MERIRGLERGNQGRSKGFQIKENRFTNLGQSDYTKLFLLIKLSCDHNGISEMF